MTAHRTALTCAVTLGLALACGPDREVYRPGELEPATVAPPAGRASIVLVGDIMTWDRSRAHLEREGPEYPFRATAPLLRSATLTVGNLEGPIAVAAEQVEARYSYKVPPWTLAGLGSAGFDLVSLANNHLRDCGRPGMTETIEHLERAGIGHFGAGPDAAAAAAPAIIDVGGARVAFLGLVAPETYVHDWSPDLARGEEQRRARMSRRLGAAADRPGTTIATRETVARLVRAARERADLVVAVLHFGVRYHRPPTDLQREVAHAAIDAGAGLVVGHHAHLWQPVELYRGTPIVYGLGNFAFGSANSQADEALLARAILDGCRIELVELFPLYVKNRDSRVDYQPKLLRGRSAARVIAELAAASAPLGATISLGNGRGVLQVPVPEEERACATRRTTSTH